jgi:hypothetical protein
MPSRLILFFVALALPVSFPAQSARSLRDRYGQPLSETFLVRPGIVASAAYGASGKVCELVISRQQPDGIIKRWPASEDIDNSLLKNIENELVPIGERGKFKIGTLLGLVTCLPENDCHGAAEEWEKVGVYRNIGRTGSRYETIHWKRAECAENTDQRIKSQ